jgi:osmoprotectant transport system substrate-binding protein
MRRPPTPSKVCKVFEGETLGVDLVVDSGRTCGLERCGRRDEAGSRVPGYVKLECLSGDLWLGEKGIPQGLKPLSSGPTERPKAEALGYLEAVRRFRLDGKRGLQDGLCGFVALAMLGLWLLAGCAPPKSSRITIGAKNFTEQVVLGELLSQEIEAVTGETVARRFYLAGSYLCQQALVSGRIDGYVEYTGTALTAILKQPLPPVGQRDEATVFRRVSELYASRYGVKVGLGLGFEDTFAMVVRGEDARRLGLKTISDAVKIAPDPEKGWRLGVGYEFQSRPDGLRGLEATYGLKFAGDPRTMDLGLLYRALSSGQVDMVAGNSTDGPIRALGFVVLEDDRHYFPPYEAVPLVREDSLRRHPGIQVAMDRLAGKVSAEEVRRMNYAVDSEHRDVGDVVREFRKGKGL